jgi:hypothetical protein
MSREDFYASPFGVAYSAYAERPRLNRLIGKTVWGGDTRRYYESAACARSHCCRPTRPSSHCPTAAPTSSSPAGDCIASTIPRRRSPRPPVLAPGGRLTQAQRG